jgi:gas vesicle protein
MARHHDDEQDEDERYYVVEERGGGIGSFLLGAAIGAGIALLLAPQSGEETRRGIKRRARQVEAAARDAAGDISDTMVDRYEQAKRSVEGTIDSARQAIDMKKAQAVEAIRAGPEAAAQARSELEARLAETKAAYHAGADVARTPRRTASNAPADLDTETGDPHAR